MSAAVVVFDAHCLLCSAWVRFLLEHDRDGVFRCASVAAPEHAARFLD